MQETTLQYRQELNECREIFTRKNEDYGPAWRVLRPSSITDQIFIKAQRIRSIEEKGVQKVGETVESEFRGIVNYCIIALIQLELLAQGKNEAPGHADLCAMYDKHADEVMHLMLRKNHDYGEAWRDMRISTFTDLILMKIMRVKQIEDNDGSTQISEGVEANYSDMMNYAIFALIRLKSNSKQS
ncbi:MAG: DUF1599 domain-containing protein [Bacteroidetes bacterium]|nr:DUF1599 domain-containing protein [Bacteroidota bacterium]